MLFPFKPIALTATLATTPSTASASQLSTATWLAYGNALRVVSSCTAVGFLVTSTSTASLTAASSLGHSPILPGTEKILIVHPETIQVATVVSSGSGTIYVTKGEGGF